jgi:hypothetical protein
MAGSDFTRSKPPNIGSPKKYAEYSFRARAGSGPLEKRQGHPREPGVLREAKPLRSENSQDNSLP